jgi:hypothetical protein
VSFTLHTVSTKGDLGLTSPRSSSFIQNPTITLGFPSTHLHDSDKAFNTTSSKSKRASGRENLKSESGRWDEVTVACVTWNLAECLPKMTDIRYAKKSEANSSTNYAHIVNLYVNGLL